MQGIWDDVSIATMRMKTKVTKQKPQVVFDGLFKKRRKVSHPWRARLNVNLPARLTLCVKFCFSDTNSGLSSHSQTASVASAIFGSRSGCLAASSTRSAAPSVGKSVVFNGPNASAGS